MGIPLLKSCKNCNSASKDVVHKMCSNKRYNHRHSKTHSAKGTHLNEILFYPIVFSSLLQGKLTLRVTFKVFLFKYFSEILFSKKFPKTKNEIK